MKQVLILFLAGLLLFPAQAARRVGEAQVQADANSQPCFTISEREEGRSGKPDFQSVSVTEGGRALWRMSMPHERTFQVSSSMCIPYGGRVPALPQTPAAPLGEGKIYTVEVEARRPASAAAPLRYVARFCLARRTGGLTAVHQIDADGARARELHGCQGLAS